MLSYEAYSEILERDGGAGLQGGWARKSERGEDEKRGGMMEREGRGGGERERESLTSHHHDTKNKPIPKAGAPSTSWKPLATYSASVLGCTRII
jgi:hypothetical protein